MFIVLLKFSENKAQAGQFMDGHNAWIKQGFDDNVFLLVGSVKPNKGGAVIAYNTTQQDLEDRLKLDPFITENVVTAEIIEISPAKAVDKFSFLLN